MKKRIKFFGVVLSLVLLLVGCNSPKTLSDVLKLEAKDVQSVEFWQPQDDMAKNILRPNDVKEVLDSIGNSNILAQTEQPADNGVPRKFVFHLTDGKMYVIELTTVETEGSVDTVIFSDGTHCFKARTRQMEALWKNLDYRVYSLGEKYGSLYNEQFPLGHNQESGK